MNKLFNKLPQDEVNEDEAIYTVGDSLLYQFYCGNWSASVKEMTDNNYSTTDLIKYINSLDDCVGGWLDWFDRDLFAELGASTVKLN